MDTLSKLQVKPGQTVAVLGRAEPPVAFLAELATLASADAGPGAVTEPATADTAADAVIAFVTSAAELGEPWLRVAFEAAREDRLVWFVYPKGGQLGTDLNRDRLAAVLAAEAIEPVRQVAIDDVWSGLRFRPAR